MDSLEGSKILITGGCGFIGSATARVLLSSHKPSKIIIIDNMSRGRIENLGEAARDNRLIIHHADISNRSDINSLFQGVDIVFHFAALRITACAENPYLAFETMAKGSINVLESSRENFVKKIVAASSASVYGLAESFPTIECHHPYNDKTFYGSTKLFLEGLLRSYYDMFKLKYLALRYFNVYGPGMDSHGKYTEVMIRWMDRLRSGESPIIFGSGTDTMDFVYITDVVAANILAATSDESGYALNIGSGYETSLSKLAEMMMAVVGNEKRIDYQPARTVNAVSRRLADTSLAEKAIAFRAKTQLSHGLAALWDWYEHRCA